MNKETKIGILASVSIAFFIFGYNLLSGGDLFSSSNKFYAKYDKIDGLSPSNPVYIHGYKVGKVEDVSFLSVTKPEILVRFSVKKEIEVPKGSVAEIFNADIIGSKGIRIVPGEQLTDKYASGDTIAGECLSSLTDEVTAMVDPLAKKTIRLMSSVDSTISTFQMILDDGGTENLQGSFASLETSMAKITKISNRMNEILGENSDLSQTLVSLKKITRNMDQREDDINDLLASLNKSAKSFEAIDFDEAADAVKDLAAIMEKVNEGEGSLGKLVNDENLYKDLNQTVNSLDRLLVDFNENPKRYVNFSFISFGGRNKKDKGTTPPERQE